ncbi:HNH endonuclease [Sphingomonas sp.]|uniref:HNH endonuclease n=1 Tax=Sphingomonas sp. TaxID=28214 RepID=UPI003D6D958D
MTMPPAARVGDDIAHSNAGTGMLLGILAGAAIGAVLVAATVATGGLALVAAAGAAAGMVSAGGLGGMYIGEASMGPPCGKFVTGSPNVFINGRPATFTFGSFAMCSKDGGSPIPLATGSSTVMINIGMAGRQDEKIGCSAKSVPQVSPNVFIGGESAQDPRVEITPEVPAWAVTTLQVLGIAGAIAALPFAIATVGVAATLGGLALGFVGAKFGAQGGRALGEALGMSEAGIRSLEMAGGFLGGMAGGMAGTKGVQAFNSRYQIKVDPNSLGMNGGNVRITRRPSATWQKPTSQGAWRNAPNPDKWRAQGGTVTPRRGGGVTYENANGVKVNYNSRGYPDFKPHAVDQTKLPGGFQNRPDDFRAANTQTGRSQYGSKSPPNQTWHHHEDGTTMQLVPRDIHNQFTHAGGIAGTHGGP